MPKIVDHDQKRNQIAQAAVQTIAEKGLESLRLIDIARAANATTGTLTHYFGEKNAVLAAALELLASEIHELALRDSLIELTDLIWAVLPTDEENKRHWRAWFTLVGRMLNDPKLRAFNKEYYNTLCTDICTIVERTQSHGMVRNDIDAARITDAIVTFCDGLSLRICMEGDESWPPERIRRQIDIALGPFRVAK